MSLVQSQSCFNEHMQVVAHKAQHGFIAPCQTATINGQGNMHQGVSPNGQFMASPSVCNFMQTPNGQFMASPDACNFMQTPHGQFMASPNVCNFMQTPNSQFMASPNVCNFMQTPNGQFMASSDSDFVNSQLQQQCFVQSQAFVQAPVPQGEVSEKVLNWLSQKALATLGEVIADESDAESEVGEADGYAPLLEGLELSTVGAQAEAILRMHTVSGTEALAAALVGRAAAAPASAAACANLLTVLLNRLPAGHRREAVCGPAELLGSVVQRCHAELAGVETEDALAGAHGSVLLLGELFKRALCGMGAIKALFGRLVFAEARPCDHAASLACHLFLTVGASLERCAAGRKLSDCMCARLRELKGINFSEATLFSLAHVTDLKLNKWVAKKAPKAKKAQQPAQAAQAAAPPAARKPDAASQDGKVLRIGELFAEQKVAMAVVKQLFQQLLFALPWAVQADRAGLARQLLQVVGPTLEQSEPGQRLLELVALRLRELGTAGEAKAGGPRAFTFPAQVAAC